MPIDPSIVLGIKPLEQQDPYKQYAVAAQLRDAAQLQQLRGLEIAETTSRQRTEASVDAALSHGVEIDPATGVAKLNRQKVVSDLNAAGQGRASFGLQQGWEKEDLAHQKAMLEQQGMALKNAASHAEVLGGIANSINAVPPEQRAAVYQQKRYMALSTGLSTPDEFPEQYTQGFVDSAQQQAMKASEIFTAQHQKVEEQQKSVQLAQEAQNNAANQMLRGQQIEAEKRGQNITMRGQNMTDARERQRLSIEAGRFRLDQQKQSIDQGGAIDAQAQQIAKGELPLPPQSRNNPYTRAVTQRALELNPQLSTNLYSTVQDYFGSKGKANQRITTLNTLADHLQDLQKASDEAGFSPVGFTSAGKALRLGQQLFSNEDVKFLAGTGVAHEGELNLLRENIHSPIAHIRTAALKTLATYTADAARQVANQFTRDTRMPFDSGRAFTDNTRKLLGATEPAQTSGQPKATHRYNPATGKIEAF